MGARASRFVRVGAIGILALCAAPGALAQFNENCTVSVLNRNVRVNPDLSWVLPNVPANFGSVRARVTCIVDGQTISGESDLFTVPPNGVVNLPHVVFGQTTPIPTSLTLTAPTHTLTQAGATVQLAVSGTSRWRVRVRNTRSAMRRLPRSPVTDWFRRSRAAPS